MVRERPADPGLVLDRVLLARRSCACGYAVRSPLVRVDEPALVGGRGHQGLGRVCRCAPPGLVTACPGTYDDSNRNRLESSRPHQTSVLGPFGPNWIRYETEPSGPTPTRVLIVPRWPS